MADIEQALKAITGKLAAAQKLTDYYNGNHELNFASENFRNTFGRTVAAMRDNLCPIVVEAIADRMEVINFAGQGGTVQPIDDKAWKLWVRHRMPLISNDVHREALKTGAGYLLVWTDSADELRFFAQDSRQCALIRSEDDGTPLFGAKLWLTGKRFRLTLYYADRIEKYITSESFSADISNLKAESFVAISEDAGESYLMDNPYGRIPMFEFTAPPVLTDCLPIQDALNKTICDKLVAMEFAAYRQRYATGLEFPVDEVTGETKVPFKAGADRLWFTDSTEAKFGEFAAADLPQFLAVADAYRLEMARVSGTPLHFFSIQTGNAVSGEALKTLESRFTKRVKRLCINAGAVWGEVIRFALIVEGGGDAAANEIEAQWESPEQRSEKELLETQILKQQIGVPDNVLQEEIGYTKEDISGFGTAETDLTNAVNVALDRTRK